MADGSGIAVPEPVKSRGIDWTPEERAVLDARLALNRKFPIAFAQWNAVEAWESPHSNDYRTALEALFDALATGVDAEIWPDMGVCGGEPMTADEFYEAACLTVIRRGADRWAAEHPDFPEPAWIVR